MEIKRRFGEIRELPKDVEDTRTVQFVISNATKDRHGTVLNPDGWDLENYRKNPIVAYNHDIYGGLLKGADPDRIIGTSRVFTEGDKLIGEVTFEPPDVNEFAEKIFKKVKHGTMRTASVGFYSKGEGAYGEEEEAEDGDNPTFYFAGQELLEWSIVNLPSNPDAVKRATEEDKTDFVMHIFREILGDKLTDEDIEKLTVKGLLDTINGRDAEKIQEEDEGKVKKNYKLKGIQLQVRTRLNKLKDDYKK